MTKKKSNTIQVLDKGSITLIDVMGSDADIASSARVSYNKDAHMQKSTIVGDTRLLRYLMSHEHWSPFEMVEMKFHVKMPIFVARQWGRHRTANINEISGRYTELLDGYYMPNTIRMQSLFNKQGSVGRVDEEEEQQILEEYQIECEHLFGMYGKWVEEEGGPSVAKEQARIILPLSTYTEWIWKCDLRNIFNFLRLRLDSHAQMEIRVYAEAMAKLVKEYFPISYKAFEDYLLNSLNLSAIEVDIINGTNNIRTLSKRELSAFKVKLERLGLDEILRTVKNSEIS